MPEISRFFGIVIRMYYDDHNPPHLHAAFGEKKAKIDFRGNIIIGDLGSKTALKLVRDWIDLHQAELLDDWELARAEKDVKKITPLE
ncbi:MAG: DUF4160 domain-containing protein [Candidatus Omnitrophica bacterium]|nr:DUF4160 domain-containing protein [Candidatus Omnitrophota bacterium]